MLRDKLKSEVVVAMKARDQKRVDVLRYLVSLIDKKELQLPVGGLTEAVEVTVLQKELKNKEESKVVFEKAGRNELVEQLNYEIEVVKEYLPKGLSDDEVKKMVEDIVAGGETNFGMIMKQMVGKVAGRASSEVVSRAVKEMLAK